MADEDKGIPVIVNGKRRTSSEETLDYEQVVFLAVGRGPTRSEVYTVTYINAVRMPDGTLARGDAPVKLSRDKNAPTTFNVTLSDQT